MWPCYKKWCKNVVLLTNIDFFFAPLTKQCPAGLFKASVETVNSKLNVIILVVIVYVQLSVAETRWELTLLAPASLNRLPK